LYRFVHGGTLSEPQEEQTMIELTDEQIHSLGTAESKPPRAVNPHTNETFVLLRVDEYERLTAADYDDSPWTRDELEALAWETSERREREADARGQPPVKP
jgi:hypothetical protein